MLVIAACSFSVSCVAFLSAARRPSSRLMAGVTFAAAAASLASSYSVLVASLVLAVLFMSAASVLVLVLAPVPQRARPVGLVTGVLGALAVSMASVFS